MRLVLFILTTTTLSLFATGSYSQNAKVSIDMKNSSIKDVLTVIEKSSEFFFIYNNELIDVERKVDLNVKNQKIGDILARLFRPEEVEIAILDRKIILAPAYMKAQQQNVTGIVTDATNGEPIIGANVIIEGTTTGVVTDENGKFTLSIPKADAILVVTYLGYNSERIQLNGQALVEIKLIPDIKRLDEVVVIGYGTTKRKDLTGAVSTVRSEDLVKRRPVTLEQGIQGLAAGVQVIRTSGSPEGKASIRIRGTATINNSGEPLYVVDGIMVGTDARFLNPSDIESIEVLKDASATAIYGSRGANGIIMITTKKGSKGRTNLTFDASFGVQNQNKTIDVANAQQFATAANKAAVNDGTVPNPVWANPAALNSIDWQREMIQPSLSQQYNFSVSGGSENTQSLLSIGYLNNNGVVMETNFKRLTARANITHKIKSFINSGLNISFARSESHGNGNLMNYASNIPTMDTLSNGSLVHVPIQYPDGTWGHFPREGGGNYNSPGADNSVAVAKTADDLGYVNRVLTNAFVEINILKGLTYKAVGGINYNGNGDHTYNAVNFRPFYNNPTDDLYLNQKSWSEYILENYFTYNGTFGKSNVTGLLGHSVSRGSSESVKANASDFAVNTIRDIGLSLSPETIIGGGGLGIETREQSFFGRVTYSYGDRYLFTGTVRRDGSSNFGIGNKYGTFPSLSFGWRISEEGFMKNQNLFSNLKFRVGWGQTGNSGNATNLSVDQVTSDRIAYYFYNQNTNQFATASGLAQIQEIDTNLKWETNEQLNFGIDMSFLENSLTITSDYYRRDALDLLLYRGLRPSTGYTQIYTNAGHIRNTGFEFQVEYRKSLGDWDFKINANATTLKNEAIDVGAPIYSNNDVGVGDSWGSYSITKDGYPVGSYFGWRTDGLFQTQAEIDALNANAIAKGASKGAYQSIGTKPGDRKYKDLDGNGWIDDKDREILGDGYADLTYGLNLSATYKNFDLNIYLYGMVGQNILSYSYRNLTSFATNNILADYAVNAWDGDGSSGKYPRLTKSDLNKNGQISDAFILDGDFLKVQNLQLGYNIPKDLLSRVKMESARVFFSAENILTLTKYNIGDPEVGNGNVQQTGFDGGRYPFPRIWTLGFNFSF